MNGMIDPARRNLTAVTDVVNGALAREMFKIDSEDPLPDEQMHKLDVPAIFCPLSDDAVQFFLDSLPQTVSIDESGAVYIQARDHSCQLMHTWRLVWQMVLPFQCGHFIRTFCITVWLYVFYSRIILCMAILWQEFCMSCQITCKGENKNKLTCIGLAKTSINLSSFIIIHDSSKCLTLWVILG